MANIFCQDCGAKTAYTLNNKPKFCQSCGEKFKEAINASVESDEKTSGHPPLLGKLDYSIEMEGSKTTLGDLLKNPMNPTDITPRETVDPSKAPKTPTKEEFLAQSMAECAPRQKRDGA
mgnify:CR=1 FL=1|jgi:hypothetical protein